MSSGLTFYRIIITGNLFVGLCAWALFQAVSLLFQDEILLSPGSVLIFCGTVLYYSFHQYEHSLNYSSPGALIRSIRKVSVPFPESMILMVLTGLALTILFLMDLKIVLLFSGLSIPCLFYSLPLIKIRGQYTRLRECNKLKVIFVSLTWALATVLIPAVEIGIAVPKWQLILRLMSITFFVYALCIPFEIRDQLKETKQERDVDPAGISSAPTVSQAFCALFFSALSAIPLFISGIENFAVFIAQLAVFLLTGILLKKMPHRPADFFCKVWVDGMMILYFLMVFISLKLHEILS